MIDVASVAEFPTGETSPISENFVIDAQFASLEKREFDPLYIPPLVQFQFQTNHDAFETAGPIEFRVFLEGILGLPCQ